MGIALITIPEPASEEELWTNVDYVIAATEASLARTHFAGDALPVCLAEQRDDLAEVRDHLRRYRDLMSQGKYSEAGKEIEALERMAAKK